MSVLIGDLMAVADSGYGAGGKRKKKSRKRGAFKKAAGESGGGRDPSDRKKRGPQDDKAFIREPLIERAPRAGSLRVAGKLPPKKMGELSELDFLRKGMGMGMIVSKPWGDSYKYDFVCDAGGRLWRVQVRSTDERFGCRGYAVHASVYVGKKIVGLTDKDIDVLVGYIVSRDIWYVVPVKAFMPRKNLWFYPDGSKKGAMFEKYREGWELMMKEKKRRKR